MVNKKLTYTEAINEIEEILQQIEDGELDVDKLTEKVKRVSALIKFCKAKLQSTEKEVNTILGEENEDEE